MNSKKIILSLWAAILIITLNAQKIDKKYKETSEILKKEIWAWDKPQFSVKTVPESHSKASSVVIARHIEIAGDKKNRTKLSLFGFAAYSEITLNYIIREAVKINDKSALDDYSEISFTKFQRGSSFAITNKTSLFIGVRVIKPNGSMVEVDADDFVQTKDEKNKKEAKLAVPNLQIGDIIDYYIAKQYIVTSGADPDLQRVFNPVLRLYDDVPVMHFSLHIELGKKFMIEYRSINGAPELRLSTNEDEEIILDVEKKDLQLIKSSTIWYSPLRELPVIILKYGVGYKGMGSTKMNTRKPGEVIKNQTLEEYVEDEAVQMTLENSLDLQRIDGILSNTQAFFKKQQKKQINIPDDSLMAQLFYALRFKSLLHMYESDEVEDLIRRPQAQIGSELTMRRLSKLFKEFKIENSTVLTTSKYGPRLQEVMGTGFEKMIVPNIYNDKIFGISDIFSPAFYIPSECENTADAVTLDNVSNFRIKASDIRRGKSKIGVNREPNLHLDKLTVTLNPDGANIEARRNSTIKGHYKSSLQKTLVTYEEYYEAERKEFIDEPGLLEKLEDSRKTRKFAIELETAFNQERQKQKEKFLAEAKDWYELEITDIKDCQVLNIGSRHYKPDFNYASSFKINGIVKKAGNNLIFDVGKLQGSPFILPEDQRKRDLDIYMPFARTIETNIDFQIPEGYSVEGVNALNRKVENECASFTVQATLNEKILSLQIQKVYKNAFEPKQNWEKLLAIIDASAEFANAKLLLKKK